MKLTKKNTRNETAIVDIPVNSVVCTGKFNYILLGRGVLELSSRLGRLAQCLETGDKVEFPSGQTVSNDNIYEIEELILRVLEK